VLNHGLPRDPTERRLGGRTRFAAQSRWFTERGFAVLVPMRRGYGDSEGPWTESEGACDEPDFLRAGAETARDIGAAVRFVSARADVDPRRVLLVGVSAGGFGALALASQGGEGVSGVVSFAGGRGSLAPGRNCSPQRLVTALGVFGSTTRTPTLWLYAENDTYFAPWLARDMREAFVKRGGKADLVVLPAFGGDGHGLFASPQGIPIWAPHVESFLTRIGLRS
jgi:dienelactone hydrolase